jgi:hypothetical protein
VTVGIGEILLFIGLALVVGAAGIALGILVLAPRLTRVSDRDEEPGDRTDDRADHRRSA